MCWVIEDFHKMPPKEKIPFAQWLKIFSERAYYERKLKEGKTAAEHSAPSNAAAAAPGTSASSPSSATARRGSGASVTLCPTST